MKQKNLGKLRKRAEDSVTTKEKPVDEVKYKDYEAELKQVIRDARKNKKELMRLYDKLSEAGVLVDQIKVDCYGSSYNAEMKEGKIKINNLGKAQQEPQFDKKSELAPGVDTPKPDFAKLQKKLDALFTEQQPKNDGIQKIG